MGFKLKSFGGCSLLLLVFPGRSWLMELLPWEWREPEQEEVTSLCRLDPTPLLQPLAPRVEVGSRTAFVAGRVML